MKQVLNIAYYEILHIFRDKLLFLIVFVVPLLYALLFGFVYMAGTLSDIPLAIVDLDDSPLSREIVTAFNNHHNFKTITDITDYEQLEKAMNDGTVRAGVVIPEDFALKLSQHRQIPVLTVYDGSNLVWALNIRKYTLEVINEFSAKNTAGYLVGLGYSEEEAKSIVSGVTGDIRIWYNPTNNYTTFLYPGLLLMIVHQIGLLSISLSVTREKENRSWLQYLCTSLPKWKIFVGKSLPYYIANFFNYALLLWVGTEFFNIKIVGSTGLLVLLGLLYTLIITAVGFFISTIAPNSLQATRYIMLLSVPFFMISGFTWPQTHIPEAFNFLARLLPFTWMSEGYRLVTLKELDFHYLQPTVLALTVMAVLSILLALSFKKRRVPPKKIRSSVNCGLDYPKRDKPFRLL